MWNMGIMNSYTMEVNIRNYMSKVVVCCVYRHMVFFARGGGEHIVTDLTIFFQANKKTLIFLGTGKNR